MDFGALITGGLPLVKKLNDLVSYILNRQWRKLAKLAAAYVIGVAFTFVAAHSDFASLLGISGLNAYSLALGGLVVGSTAALGADVIASADNSQSAAVPSFSLKLFRKAKPKPAAPAETAALTPFKIHPEPADVPTYEAAAKAAPAETEPVVAPPRKRRPAKKAAARKQATRKRA